MLLLFLKSYFLTNDVINISKEIKKNFFNKLEINIFINNSFLNSTIFFEFVNFLLKNY